MKAAGLIGGPVVTVLANVMANAMNAPTWALVTITVLGLACVLVLGLFQLAMPQDSQDKRLLWERLLEHRERRRGVVPVKKSKSRRAVRAAPEQDTTVAVHPRSPTLTDRTARSP